MHIYACMDVSEAYYGSLYLQHRPKKENVVINITKRIISFLLGN